MGEVSKLQEIKRGAVIAGRYVVSEELRPWLPQFPDHGSILLALDAILDTPVIVYVAPKSVSGDLLDAGRRSALLSDPRIPSITDVGTWEGYDYVVCERTGGTSLARILQSGPILEPEARAIVGELATALTHAASRGLHHGLLGPESVAVTADQEVIVRGIAIDAAIADEPLELGISQLSPAEAKRRDALSLVNILYACLSARWPGDEPRAGLPASGRKNNRIVSLHSLVDTFGIPADIESFASNVVSGIEPGPRSPSEIVRFLGTWDTAALKQLDQSARTEDELFTATAQPSGTQSAGAQSADSQPAAGIPAAASGQARTASGQARTASGTAAEPVLPHTSRKRATQEQLSAALARVGLTRPGTLGVSAGVAGAGYDQYDDQMTMRSASVFPIAADKLDPKSTWPEPFDGATQADEIDPNLTAPILHRDDDAEPSTAAIDIVAEEDPDDGDYAGENDAEDDGSWFLGGMFETREQKFAAQKAEFERERRLQRQAQARLSREEELPAPKPAFNIRSAEAVDPKTFAGGALAGAGAAAGGVGAAAGAGEEKDTSAAESAKDAQSAAAQSDAEATGAAGSGAARASQAAAQAKSGSGGKATAKRASGRADSAGSGAAGSGAASAAGSGSKGSSQARTAAGAGTAAGAAKETGAAGRSAGGKQTAEHNRGQQQGSGGAANPRNSKLIPALLIALAVIVIIALVFVFMRPGSGDEVAAPQGTETAEADAQESTEPTEAPAKPVDIGIAKVTALDPEGDGAENDDQADTVVPGVKGSWQTDRYNSAKFGGLKSGLGLALQLKEASPVGTVTVESSFAGGSFDVLVGDSDKIDDAKKVGSGKFAAKDVTDVALDEPVTGEYVFIWITELPAESDGFRARIPRISITT